MSLVSSVGPQNPNHLSNQVQQPRQNQAQQPSVQNARGPQTATQAAESVENTGNHTQVQAMDESANSTNPLHAQQQSIRNQNVARGGF
ncbi:MAG: hypothetical protein FJ390_01950 [Verrucomicrobia bacterium]|nr:hypothetical protein [Verrucomicrobiota bacterium]